MDNIPLENLNYLNTGASDIVPNGALLHNAISPRLDFYHRNNNSNSSPLKGIAGLLNEEVKPSNEEEGFLDYFKVNGQQQQQQQQPQNHISRFQSDKSVDAATKAVVVSQLRQERKILMSHLRQLRNDQRDTTLTRTSNHVGLLSLGKYKNIKAFKGHNNRVVDMKTNSETGLMLSCGSDGHAIVWKLENEDKTDLINLDVSWTMCCAMSEDSRLVAFAGLENSVTLYATYNPDFTAKPHSGHIGGTGAAGKGNQYHTLLTTAAQGGNFDRDAVAKLKGHKAYVSEMDFLDRIKLLSASGDYTVKLWDTMHQRVVNDYSEHCGQVSSIQCHPKNRLIFLSSASDGTIKIWDARLNRSAMTLQAHHADIVTTRFVTERCGLASAAEDGTLRLYDLRSDSPIESFSWLVPGNNFNHATPLGEFNNNQLSSDPADSVLERQALGSYLSDYGRSYSRYKQRQQMRNMEEAIAAKSGNRSNGNRAGSSSDGASTTSPLSVNGVAPEPSVSFLSNPGVLHLTVLASSMSHRLLFLGYDDGTVCVLDILKGRWISHFQAHSDRISQLSVLDDKLYSSSYDGTVKAWILNKRPV